MSFSQGVFPTKYKLSVVTPLLKKPNLNSDVPANFRPISNLNISKIIERLFLSRIQPHVCSSGNISPTQLAYRRYHSTETALLHTLHYVYPSSDNRQPTIVASLDFSSAFDTIDHAILLSRLSDRFGLSGNALAWVESYLQNRYHCVQLDQAALTGVPQGSVLGPLLFSCYVSPISSIASSHNVGIQQYAHDTQLYIALKASESSTQLAQFSSCLSSFHDWFCHNGLSLNSSKSESILFGSCQRMCAVSQLSLNLPSLAQLFPSQIHTQTAYLALCRNIHYHSRALRHIRLVLSIPVASSVVAAIVQSRLDYVNSLLYGTSTINIHKLQCTQNTLLNCSFKLPISPSPS